MLVLSAKKKIVKSKAKSLVDFRKLAEASERKNSFFC